MHAAWPRFLPVSGCANRLSAPDYKGAGAAPGPLPKSFNDKDMIAPSTSLPTVRPPVRPAHVTNSPPPSIATALTTTAYCSKLRAVNRRLALFRLAALPGALAAMSSARAQQTVEMPTAPFAEPPVSLTVTPTLESLAGGQPASAPLRAGVDEFLFKALSLVGVRYRPGGNTPETGFDCSGYVCYLYREVYSMTLPRTSDAMAAVQRGENIPRNALQPGDLVFFNTMRRPYTHVGIYVGEDRMVHAPSSGGLVRVESLNERYWVKRWNGARRISA